MADAKPRWHRDWILPLILLPSALDPAGQEASRILQLFWWMSGGTGIVWLAVILITLWCVRVRPEKFTRRAARLMIVLGGAVVPAVVLVVLLLFTFATLPALVAPAPAGSLKIAVSGEQWWWRVRYVMEDGRSIELANEIHLPLGAPVEFRLDSPDVIHSFWIPPLGGKVDMIPGRVTRLVLNPTKVGVFRGVCAEYCGASHAFMRFPVVVQERDEFDRWLTDQQTPAQTPSDPLGVRGQTLFLANGCGACHSIRGTPADGVIAPDLTHVGSRLSLAAESLPNEVQGFRAWISATHSLKPGAQMPPFPMLPSEDLDALATYLDGLK
jgi:cytochrome c oxidase subunit 2